MSFQDYLHEKAEESRHNETLAYLTFLAGAIFLMGGILETLSLAKNPEWLLFIPYHTEPIAGAALGLTLIISGFSLMIFGIATGINYSRHRNWYMQELRKASSLADVMMDKKTARSTSRKKKNA